MTLLDQLRHYRRLAPVVILRETPLPWRWKRWIVWGLSPRYALGVCVVIRDAAGQVLMLRSAYSRHWQLPGGGVNYHESFEQAMRREGREELGSEPRGLRMVALLTDSSGRGLHAVFRGELSGEPIRLSEEHTEWRFTDVAGLPPFFRSCVAAAGASSAEPVASGSAEYED